MSPAASSAPFLSIMPSRKRNKRQAPQTKKERNTQQRKRKTGLEHKAYQMGTLCGFELALLMYNPEKDEYYVFMTTDQMRWNVDDIVSDPFIFIFTT